MMYKCANVATAWNTRIEFVIGTYVIRITVNGIFYKSKYVRREFTVKYFH